MILLAASGATSCLHKPSLPRKNVVPGEFFAHKQTIWKHMNKIKIAQFGLGPIGVETLKLAATKPWAEIIGGIDIDSAKVGKNLAEITGLASLKNALVYRSLEELLEEAK